MKENHQKLLDELDGRSTPISASDLANALGISLRTVKNYVAEINESEGFKAILSSRQGYYLALGFIHSQRENKHNIPQTYLERAYYLVKRILIEHRIVNIFDVCEEMYISFSTLKSTIAKMNQTFERFSLRFACKNDIFIIEGSEKNKRRLAGHIIFEETNSRFLDFNTLEKSFSQDDVKAMSAIIRNTFRDYDCYINDFSFMGVLLHLLIIIERVRKGKTVEVEHPAFENFSERPLTLHLIRLIEEEFDVHLSGNERAGIMMLMRGNVNQGLSSGAQQIRDAVGPAIMDATTQLVDAVKEVYGIDLQNDRFLPPFALHMKGLLVRIANGMVNKNPMLSSIKRDCRVIYDIAVYIALIIGKEAGKALAEDEIAYIALHVGAEVERQRQNTNKVRCALLCPGYMGIEDKIYHQLMTDYVNDVDIIGTVSSVEDLQRLTFDLLFTTVEVERKNWISTQLLPPFEFTNRKAEISDRIEQVRVHIKKDILRRNFADFFIQDLFYSNPEVKNKKELLSMICGDMVKLGCVTPDFLWQVEEREAASTTAFGKLAMPHSAHMDAIRTRIAVAVSKEGIEWEKDKIVHVVLLTAINKVERRYFTDIYEALIALFEDESSFKYLYNVPSYTALKELLTR